MTEPTPTVRLADDGTATMRIQLRDLSPSQLERAHQTIVTRRKAEATQANPQDVTAGRVAALTKLLDGWDPDRPETAPDAAIEVPLQTGLAIAPERKPVPLPSEATGQTAAHAKARRAKPLTTVRMAGSCEVRYRAALRKLDPKHAENIRELIEKFSAAEADEIQNGSGEDTGRIQTLGQLLEGWEPGRPETAPDVVLELPMTMDPKILPTARENAEAKTKANVATHER